VRNPTGQKLFSMHILFNMSQWLQLRFQICRMHYVNPNKNGKHVNIQALFHIYANQTGLYNSGFNWPIWVSRQAFPRKIGQKMRAVSETHGYCNVAKLPHCRICNDTLWRFTHTVYVESQLYHKLYHSLTVWSPDRWVFLIKWFPLPTNSHMGQVGNR